MKTMLFISRHKPTPTQVKLALAKGYKLEHVGDRDAFTVTPNEIYKPKLDEYTPAVAVVHPAAALRLCTHFTVGVFENANRAPEGQPPKFEAVALHVYTLVSDELAYAYPKIVAI